MNFEVAMEGLLCAEGCTDEQVGETLEALMEALVDLEVEDPSVSGSLARRTFEISLVVTATSEEEAFALGNRLIADAVRAAGLEIDPASSEEPTISWSQKAVRPAAAV